MNVYCAGAIRGDTQFQKSFHRSIKIVEDMGHTVLSELASTYSADPPRGDGEIYSRDMGWLDQSSIMVAEISGPSLGVGYEISYALHTKNIPVLAFYHSSKSNVSAMVSGNPHPKLDLQQYHSIDDLRGMIEGFIRKHS